MSEALAALLGVAAVPPLSKEAPTPLYYQLYRSLKDAILSGSVPEGAQMPTEQQLADACGVSRITAKRAMDELADETLVERRRGKGTHVIYHYEPKPVEAPLVGMLQEIESMARHSDARVISMRRAPPPEPIAALLGLATNDKALALERVRSRDGKPFGHYASWTAGLDGGLRKGDFRTTPRLEIFRRHGLRITHVTQTISAAAATPVLAELLDTDVGAPLIQLTRHSFTTEDGAERMVDYLHTHYHPGRFQYQMDLRLDG
uniref:Transcriptional regulator, GntR family n=1 Tax=Haliea sp. ETY-M TaxID=1055105 RepID=A0A455R304_9GAMM|nr:transcriptional regulator, GntR family [Haliea sp. ETY-M]